MDASKCISFLNGQIMPLVGLGTWQCPDEEVKAAVNWALETGYRHIDTAHLYRNEAAIGEILHEWITNDRVKREELFVVTKLPPFAHRPGMVEQFLKNSLASLKLDYVDLYLVHSPMALEERNGQVLVDDGKVVFDLEADHITLWKAMEAQVDAGRTKSIGLSNFNSQQIERILENARIKPANLQVELHLHFQQKQLREFCKKRNITVCAYAPLGSKGRILYYARRGYPPADVPAILDDPIVLEIAQGHGKSPAQVLLRHLIQQGVAVIPKSSSKHHIKENFQVFDFTLTQDEMERLNQLDRNSRSFNFGTFPGISEHPDNPCNIPF